MNRRIPFWTTFLGSISAIIPFLLSCPGLTCISCGGVCYLPVIASLGISTTGFLSSEWWDILQPIFIAASAVLFTVSYYSIYKKPAVTNHCNAEGCELKNKAQPHSGRGKKIFFWISVIVCVGLFTCSTIVKIQLKNYQDIYHESQAIPIDPNL